MSTTRTREWLLYNAVEAWLANYGNQPTETVSQYKELREEFRAVYMATLSKDADDTPPAPKSPRKRTRNASQSSAKTV